MNYPSDPPSWLRHWPDTRELAKTFPNGVKIFFNRNKAKMNIGAIRWLEDGVGTYVDRYKCSWNLANGTWKRQCNCGMKSGLCAHNYALAQIVSEYCNQQHPDRGEKSPSRQSVASETTSYRQPVQKDLFTARSASYIKVPPTQQSRQTNKSLTVEVDFKTSPGFALVRFYDEVQGKRRMLKISEVYSHAATASYHAHTSIVWRDDDRAFLSWLRNRMDYTRIEHYRKMTALKISRKDFDVWLCHWREIQPGRFIERDTQQAVTGGDDTIKLRIELSEEGDRTLIAAIAIFPDGKKRFFHELARDIVRQQKAAGEEKIDFNREYLFSGNICRIDYPLTPQTVWDLFHKKNPSMATEHICQHLPVLLENRLELVGGPAVKHKPIKSKLILKAKIGGDSLVITPQLGGKNIDDCTLLQRINGSFIVSEQKNDFIDDAKLFLQHIDAVKNDHNYIVKLKQDTLDNISKCWETLPPSIEVEADKATNMLLNPTILTPSLNAATNGRWVDLFTSWHADGNSVFTESINFAIKNKSNFLRSREGNWIRLDLEAITTAFSELEESGLGFGFQRHVASEAVRLLDSDAMQPLLNESAVTTLRGIKASLRQEYALCQQLEPILRSYQRDGFQFLKQMDMYQIGCILADDMGLGKTIQTLALLQSSSHLDKTPSLVCAPASVINVWLNEAAKFAPSLKVAVAHGTSTKRLKVINNAHKYDLIITTYGSMRNDADALAATDFNFLLLDEAQYIRNPSTKAYKAVCSLRARQRIAITGTPVENSATDLWSIVNFLNPGFLGALDDFRSAYDNSAGKEARQRLAARIAPLLLRRTKEVVAKELPPKTVESIVVEMLPKQRDAYREYLSQLTQLCKSDESNSIKMLAMLTRLRQICCSPQLLDIEAESAKLNCLLEMIEEITAEGHSVLIFSSFTSMLEIIGKRLTEANLSWRKITGQTPVNKRPQLVKEFNESQNPELFLLSLKAAGTGLTLTKADYVFIYDPWWNPAAENQAIDRTHRIGQDKPVIAYKMVAQGTIEEEILKLQQQKQELFDDIIADSDAVPESISAELLATLMEQAD